MPRPAARGKHPGTQAHAGRELPERLEDAIERHRLLRTRDSLLVAVSGGPDSTALLAALAEIRRPGWRIAVGHVNHHLRGRESDRDQRFVESLAARLGCAVYVVDAPVDGRANIEERARERRYAALRELARANKFRRIATAHTLDDQAETVLHRLLRGTGSAGLAAIRRDRGDGVVRPLLDVSRGDVVRFLASRGIRPRTDRSNASDRFTRNRLRSRVLPIVEREVNPAAKRALARLAELAHDDEVWLERSARLHARRAIEGSALVAAPLARVPVALRRRIVRLWLGTVRGDVRGIELEHIERILALATDSRASKRTAIPGGIVTGRDGKLFWNLDGATPALPRQRKLALGEVAEYGGWRLSSRVSAAPVAPGTYRAVFDADDVRGAKLSLRASRPGDRIRPLGLGGSKKLQDVFVDAKIPRGERPGWPVVEQAGGRILWIPGLVRSDRAPIREETVRYLVLEALRK